MVTAAKKANLTMIAEKCGVSKMTVTRVFRNDPHVSAKTRQFVLRVAEEVDFMPVGCYGPRSAQKVKHYGILFQKEYSINDAYFSDIILSIQQELFKHGLGCSFGIIENKYADFIKLNNILQSKDISGVFVVGEVPADYANTLQTNFRNLVIMDYPGHPGISQPYNAIYPDNVFGGHLAMRHLFKLGRQRILLLVGRQGHYFTNDLLRAYQEALEEHEIEMDPRLIVYADFHVKGGYGAVKRVMNMCVEFDAVFSNDEMAYGAMTALKESGLKVPLEVSVIGFDGLPIGELARPELTTIKVDRKKMGRMAVNRLLAMENEKGAEKRFEKISFFPELIVRDSCGGKKRRVAAMPQAGKKNSS